MSGGSLDYIYHKVEDVAIKIQNKDNTPLQRAFGEHLLKVAKALHDVEWVMSGDYGNGDDEKAIKAVLGDDSNGKAFAVLQTDALKLIDELKKFAEK